MTDVTAKTQKTRALKREERRKRQEEQQRYGLTGSTKAFIIAIVVLLVLLVSGAVTYLTLALNDARNTERAQDIAISEWSRRYVSLYDQYTNTAGSKPTSLSPSAVQYLINTESSNGHTSTIPGLPDTNGTNGGGSTPPNIQFTIKLSDGSTTKVTCVPASNFDPASPSYTCK